MPSVLVVDDYQDTRELLHTLLSSRGYEVYVAADGAEAVQIALDRRPSVILMDLFMPGMDGWEATRRIRSASESVATIVIAYTARPGTLNEERELFDAVCHKPCPPEDLLTLIGRVTAPDA